MRNVVCALVLTLASCVTSRPVMLPSGAQGFGIKCPGTDCMNKAAQVCAGPYQIVDRDGAAIEVASGGTYYMGAVHRTVYIECGPVLSQNSAPPQ
jgi:hypothetical protein